MRKLAVLSAIIFTAFWLSVKVNPAEIIHVNGSQSYYDAKGMLYHVKLSPNGEWQIYIPLREMGQWLPAIAVNTEDGRFYRHVGVDMLSAARAFVQNISHLRKVSGASTITSQLIRIRTSESNSRKRTLATKLYEFLSAVKLELSLNKDEILEAYLNHAPFGGNIRGVQAASLIYFGKNAEQISPAEACLLVGMLKAPSVYRPDKNPEKALIRRNEIIRLMERKKVFTADTASRARLEELPRRKYSLPAQAYHYTQLAALAASSSQERQKRVDTCLVAEFQSKLEAILRQSLEGLPDDVTYSAGISENSTGKITAWCGNARFSYGGNWIDCGRSARSPGSTLKPFAYLCAVEQGILTPSTILYDTPNDFSGRAPRNFDMAYRGAVTARTALSASLNAPAVRVLRMAGRDYVLTFLRSIGCAHLRGNAQYYGDSLILGGCETTLLEELEAYTALASGGIYRKLRLLSDDVSIPERAASQGGTWIISDMLRRPGTNYALKTGTSYGLRDAWACAYNPDYTVCVWCGKTDGSSWPGLIGAEVSAPVAVKILRAVTSKSSWYERPQEVTVRKVCASSGKPPTALCPAERNDYALSITHTTPCSLHFSAPKINLSITSPVNGASYIAPPFDAEHKIPLKAEGSHGKISWYIDGKYTGTSDIERTIYRRMNDGDRVISVCDEHGKTASVSVKIYTPAGNKPEKLF